VVILNKQEPMKHVRVGQRQSRLPGNGVGLRAHQCGRTVARLIVLFEGNLCAFAAWRELVDVPDWRLKVVLAQA
jgi:hypothetical protein